MAGHSQTDIEVARRACICAGMNPITSLSEPESTEAVVLKELYEDYTRDALTAYRWDFARTEIELPKGVELAEQPKARWQSSRPVPPTADIIHVETVFINNVPAVWELSRGNVWTNAGPNDELILVGFDRREEAYWPPYFTLYMIFRLASLMASAIARNADLSTLWLKQADDQLVKARNRDAQQATLKKVNLRQLTGARRTFSRLGDALP